MKMDSVPGEFAFKALVKLKDSDIGWQLTTEYFLSITEVYSYCGDEIKWEVKYPVEELDNGAIYIPAPEEL